MIVVLSSLFVQAGVTQQINGIEPICRCPGDTVNASKLYLKHIRLLNYAVYDKMACFIHCHLLANTITRTKFLKFNVEMMVKVRYKVKMRFLLHF